MELYKHQKEILAINPDRWLLHWDTGVGKSLAGMELALAREKPFIVITLKSLKAKWERDIAAHPSRKYLYAVLSKEEFKKQAPDLPPCNLVVDEAHVFFGITSGFYKTIIKYLKSHRDEKLAVWLMTATAYLSTPWNIYCAAKILGYEWNYWEYETKYFDRIPMGGRTVPKIKKDIKKDMALLVNQIGNTIHINECDDVPDQVFEMENFNLTAGQRTAIRELEASESNHLSRFTKIHQIENGTLKSDGYSEAAYYPSYKDDRIMELCEQNPKVAVFCRYNLQIDKLKEMLEKKKIKTLVIRGDIKDRDAVVTEAENSDRVVVLIQAQCSEGYELPSIPMIIFASLSWSYKDYKQGVGRFLRLNKMKKNVYIHLVTEGVDTAVYENIMEKQDFTMEIYAQNKI